MAFDVVTFLELTGRGQDVFTALGSAYGFPSCLTKLSKDLLQLLPSSLLDQILGGSETASAKANEDVKEFLRKNFYWLGIIEVPTEDGSVIFVSDSSKAGLGSQDATALAQTTAWLNAVAQAGGTLYTNYITAKSKVEAIASCIEKFNQILKFSNSAAGAERGLLAKRDEATLNKIVKSRFKRETEAAQKAAQFVDEATVLQDNIETILIQRAANPDLEPQFVVDLSSIVSGIFPVANESVENEGDEEIFRLVFGPPKSSTGKFLLSQDGLYYDSQTSGIAPALLTLNTKRKELKKEEIWKLEFDPNLGGRGVAFSDKDSLKYVGTLFDPDILDESESIQTYYRKDRLLQSLIGQKDKKIYDLSSQVSNYEASGYSSAIITNARQSIISEAALFEQKIIKRKKQIEIAVKAPTVYGSGPIFSPGEIPVNDFSYLKDINLSVEVDRQRKLVLNQADVSGVVKPLPIKFVYSPKSDEQSTADHLIIPGVGVGAIIYDDRDPLETSASQLFITDVVVTDGLVGIYNFLSTEVVGPKSTKFYTQNDIVHNDSLNAQLVGISPSSIFTQGLAVPYFQGISRQHGVSSTTPSATGSYAKLPDTGVFQDFMYSPKGFSIEAWLHIPDLETPSVGWDNNGASSLYRIILGNENVGILDGVTPETDPLNIAPKFGTDVTRGFLMGFTRDRRITKKLAPSNDQEDNWPTSSLSFFVAPTQSMDASTVAFTRKLVGDDCYNTDGWHSLSIDASTLGPDGDTKFGHLCREFMHIVLTVDIKNNEVKVYLDNNLMTTSSVTDVFGTEIYKPVNLPTFKRDNSFEWGTLGPDLDTFFTPWIIGGGYTDGLDGSGNFMGGEYGGLTSGLNGHIGSLKFYNKPLNRGEVEKNFTYQSPLFKNIDVPNSCWEPVV